jgi:hypothetical protein
MAPSPSSKRLLLEDGDDVDDAAVDVH